MPETSIKQKIFALLNRNPLLLPSQLCELVGLNYADYRNYVTKLRSKWRTLPRDERGSIPSSVHGWRGWTEVKGVSLRDKVIRVRAIGAGWLPTRARNKWLLWKDRFGRLQWFETGRCNVYARKPVTIGRVYQLIANAFTWTGLVTDIKHLEAMLKGIKFKSAHFVFETPQRLPKMVIDLFSKSNGVIIKMADRTHPHALEIIASQPDWGERTERLLEKFLERLNADRKPTREEPKDVPYRV